jgi:diguanylate cyclase (GGDEF)-like protein
MNADSSEFIVFSDDAGESGSAPKSAGPAPWRILIVDDDEDVHNATEFALAGLDILERPIEFLHAYSSVEAIDLLMHEQDVAVILLDVVMETEDAGLAAVTTIRRDLGLLNAQIILRTGQPGYAPELDTIRRYDINDYRTKSELSRIKLYTALTASVRAYDQLRRMDADRHSLELVVDVGSRLLETSDAAKFADIVLDRAAAILGVPCKGFMCARMTDGASLISAVSGEFPAQRGGPLSELAKTHPDIAALVGQALTAGRSMINSSGHALVFPSQRNLPFVAFIEPVAQPTAVSRQLLDVFCGSVAVCSENVNLVSRLSDLAFTDSLTGLASRRAFAAELDRRLGAVARADTAIVLLDIDQFAEINDMFGHAYGDTLLRAIADRLREGLPTDVLIARLTGDTYALLGLPDQLEPNVWRPLLTKPFIIAGEERVVSISSALVYAKDAHGEANDLIKDATIVIKRVKGTGLGRHADYIPELSEQARERSRILHDLSLAFKRNELFLMFQPQVALADNRVIGLEALIRWRNDAGKLVPPDRFIPLAENSGLIVPLGYWVLTEALAALAELQRDGYTELRMAVNVSPPQLQQLDFLDRVDAALIHAGIAPQQLEIEVTEGISIIGADQVFERLDGIRSRGIAVAIDDFGTGYSSLSYLDRLIANRLKIDRSFVTPLDLPDLTLRIAETVISLGHQLKMQVLAEGVETAKQADILRQMGCEEAQGYFFARPMLLADLKDWLKAHP